MKERVLRWGWGGGWEVGLWGVVERRGWFGFFCWCMGVAFQEEREFVGVPGLWGWEREGDERDLVCIHDELAK